MSILCVGDIHIQTNNIHHVNDFSLKIQQIIKDDQSIEFVVLMGDILHNHEKLHSVALNCAIKVFKDLSEIIPLFILVGNHCYISNSQFLTKNHWMNCVSYKNTTVVDNVLHITMKNGVQVTMCPYVPDGRFVEALNTNPGWKNSKCILSHQLFDGAKMGSIVAENIEKWDSSYPLNVVGHVHDSQVVQENLVYTGSCMQHAFGESDDKHLVKINFCENKLPTLENIYVDIRKKKILYIDVDELETFNVDTLKDNIDYKLTISGCKEEFDVFRKTQKYKTLQKRVKIVFKHKRNIVLERKERLKLNTENQRKDFEDFNTILKKLVDNEDDVYMTNLFNTIVLNINESETVLLI